MRKEECKANMRVIYRPRVGMPHQCIVKHCGPENVLVDILGSTTTAITSYDRIEPFNGLRQITG